MTKPPSNSFHKTTEVCLFFVIEEMWLGSVQFVCLIRILNITNADFINHIFGNGPFIDLKHPRRTQRIFLCAARTSKALRTAVIGNLKSFALNTRCGCLSMIANICAGVPLVPIAVPQTRPRETEVLNKRVCGATGSCLLAVRRRWQHAQTISHFFISSFTNSRRYALPTNDEMFLIFAPLQWSKSIATGGHFFPQSAHGTFFMASTKRRNSSRRC